MSTQIPFHFDSSETVEKQTAWPFAAQDRMSLWLGVTRNQLRHSNVRITLGIYGHVIGNSQRNAVNRLAKRPTA